MLTPTPPLSIFFFAHCLLARSFARSTFPLKKVQGTAAMLAKVLVTKGVVWT